MKKAFAILLAAAMLLSLAACAQKDPTDTSADTEPSTQPTEPVDNRTPEEKIVGYFTWYYSFGEGGAETLPNFFHFYTPDELMGSVFVAEFAYNQVNMAGTYTVEEKEFAYDCYPENGAEKISGTAPYTVTLFDMNGEQKDVCGFDGEHLYAMTTTYTFTGSGDAIFTKETPEESKIGEYLTGEVGVPLANYIMPEDSSSFVTIYANYKYQDMMVVFDEGSYTVAKDGENTVYKLSGGAALSVAPDGTAVYTSADGQEIAVVDENMAAGDSSTLTGTFKFMDSEAQVTMTVSNNGSCEITLSAFGQDILVDGGTYSVADGVYTFELLNGGTVTGTANAETGELEVPYKATITEIQVDIDTTLVGTISAGEKNLMLKFVGTTPFAGTDADVILAVYDDGTCEVTLSAFEQSVLVDGGTYTCPDGYSFTFELLNGGTVASSLNAEAATVEVHYVATITELGADIDAVLLPVLE